MSYRVSIGRSAEKEFLALPCPLRGRVQEKLVALEVDPRPHGSQKLRESDRYRLRTGDWRIIDSVNDARRHVLILSIGLRKEVYR